MSVKLYVLPSSTSSRKVKGFLESRNIEFVEQNMVRDPISWEQLFEILLNTENGVEDILSLRSKDYHKLIKQGVDFEELFLTEFHKLIVEYPRLLKVPIVVAKNTTMVGYSEETISVFDNRDTKKDAYLKVLDMVRFNEDKKIGNYVHSKHGTSIVV